VDAVLTFTVSLVVSALCFPFAVFQRNRLSLGVEQLISDGLEARAAISEVAKQIETEAGPVVDKTQLGTLVSQSLDARWLFKIDVEWRMPVWPQWVLAAQLADSRLVAKVQTQRNFMTEATITWGAWPGGDYSKSVDFSGFPGTVGKSDSLASSSELDDPSS
jgi:hypothetical protein